MPWTSEPIDLNKYLYHDSLHEHY